jgi:hypothetical protein
VTPLCLTLRLCKLFNSLNLVKFLHSLHECADTHVVTSSACSRCVQATILELLSAVVHSIEFSYLVAEPDSLKQHLDLIATTRLLEIVLGNS